MATAAESTRMARYLQDYQSYHHHPWNEWTHFAGIPVIVVSILGLLSRISLGGTTAGGAIGFDVGFFLWAAAATFYVWLDWRIGVPFSVMMLGFYVLGRQMMYSGYWWVLLVMFLGGWVLQLVGHYRFEKKAPAFLTNFEHLLIGPIWIYAKLVGYYRA